jgi:hypothetical protein
MRRVSQGGRWVYPLEHFVSKNIKRGELSGKNLKGRLKVQILVRPLAQGTFKISDYKAYILYISILY